MGVAARELASEVPVVCHYFNHISSRGLWFGDNPLAFSLPCLLFQLSLISLVTALIHSVLKPLGQPLIVSQILGGIVLGPSVLGQDSTFVKEVFPVTSRVVLDSLSAFGFMLFIFLIGVKVDPTMVFKTGKRAVLIGLLSFFVPFGMANFVVFLLQHYSSLDRSISTVLPHIALMQSMTAFPVVSCFLDELKILNSEIGSLATSSSFISDLCHWSFMTITLAAKFARSKPAKVTTWSCLSGSFFVSFIVFGLRPAALWAVRRTPEGKPVKEIYIFVVLVVLLSCAFIGEVIGLSGLLACLILGLVIPDGPPLGAALVEKMECFVSVLLLPLFFVHCGLQIDIYSIQNLSNFGWLQLLALVGFLGKIVATILPPLVCRMPFRDALSFSLIMNAKGIVELAILSDFTKYNLMTKECFTIMIISVLTITGIVSPLVKVLYDPSKGFLAYRRRTIMHLSSNEEFRILACLHTHENVQLIISLLELSNPTQDSRVNLVVLHLIKLMGRASSVLVPDQPGEKHSHVLSQSERIFHAFESFRNRGDGLIALHCFKGISPYATMHNDVCSLALEKRSILVVVPFEKQRRMNVNILNQAPCSVGILVDRKRSRHAAEPPSVRRVAVLFFGGQDDREALAFGKRMAGKPDVMLTLIRFTSSGGVEVVHGKDRSRRLDANMLSDFEHNTLRCERVRYQEEMAENGSAVVTVARSAVKSYDLVMVGRRHGESRILKELDKKSEELGAVGEVLTSADFDGEALVFVMQQQTRVWGLLDPEESTKLRKGVKL